MATRDDTDSKAEGEKRRRKKTGHVRPEDVDGGDGHADLPPDHEEFDAATTALIETAQAFEGSGAEKGPEKAIEAWRKVAHAAPQARLPRRELARVYRAAGRWNALVESLKELAERLPADRLPEKIEVLFEMSDVYRERLKLDVLVIQTLSQIVAADAGNFKALDLLEAQYEALKRWPDLIGVLGKKAALSGDPSRQVELWLRIAGLYIEKFSNQAEAIKAYEKVLDLDPQNGDALKFLKEMYERRRDWDKLIAAHQREIAGLGDPAEKLRRRVDVARLASEKVKKPALSIDLWKQVLEEDPESAEALGELEKLYERERTWDDLAAVLEKQVDRAADSAVRTNALTKLGILYGEKLGDPNKAIAAWKRLCLDEPENRRAVDALKKLYVQARRWEDLEDFYAPSGKWEELTRLLERQADVETDPEVRIDLLYRCARLWTERLGKEANAARAYEKILTLDENSQKAAEALIPIYSAAGDHRRLAQVLAVEVRHLGDENEKLERLHRLVEIHDRQLKDAEAAFGWAIQAVAIAPDEVWVRDSVERLGQQTSHPTEVALAYEDAFAKAATGRVPMLETLMRLYETDLADTEGALRAAQRLGEIEAEHVGALDALERIYSRQEKWADLLDVLERKRPLVTDPQSRKDLLFNRAYLYEEEIRDPAKATAAYRDLLDEAPEDARALRALDRLYAAAGASPELAEVLEREIAATAPAGAGLPEDAAAIAGFKMRLGSVRETALSDPRGALDCYRDVLDLDVRHEGARQALLPYLDVAEHQAEAARLLEPAYRAVGDALSLVRVLEVRTKHEADRIAAVEMLVEIGRTWVAGMGDRDHAFDAYRRALKLDPGAASTLAALEELADERPRAEQLAALLEDVLGETTLDGTARRELLLHLAAVAEDRLADDARAIAAYRRVLDVEPADDSALSALERLYTSRDAWTDLLDVYQRRVANESDARLRQATWFRVASLNEDMLSDVDGAISAYQSILADDEANVRALRSLDRIFVAASRHEDLADVLGREIANAQDAGDRVTLLVRLARLREESLGETAAAVDTYKQALETDPAAEAPRAALERYLGNVEYRLTAAQSLEPVYRARGDGQRLVAALEILAEAALDPEHKIRLLSEVASLRETLGDLDGAFATFGRALGEDPASAGLRRELERLARGVGHDRLIALYEERAAAATDEDLRSGLLVRVAEICEHELRDPARAAQVYERVLQQSPRHLPAADALERIYLATDQFRPLVTVLAKKVDIVEDVAARKESCFKSAQVLEDVLDDPQGAVDVYRRVLEIDVEDMAALEALERLFLRLERWQDLRDVYIRKADLAKDPGERKRMLYVLGQVYDSELREKDKAIETYKAVLDIDADDRQAMEALERLYTETERWYDLLGVLDWEIAHASTSGEAVGLRHRVGKVWEEKLGDIARAVEAYRDALETDPQYEPTLAALEAILRRPGDPVAAARVLAKIYERAVEWERLVKVLEVLAEHADDEEKVQTWGRVAQICERELLDRSRAFDATARAFKARYDEARTLAELERLAGATGRFSDLIVLYEAASIDTPDANLRCDLALRVARVQEDALADAEAAIQWYRRALEADPESRAALDSLERLFQRLDRPSDLAETLARKVEAAKGDEAIELRFRLGQIRDQRLGDPRGALDCYREILATRPDHGPTIGALEFLFDQTILTLDVAKMLDPIYVGAEQWARLARLGDVLFQGAEGQDDRRAVAQRFAEMAEKKLGDAALAFQWWGKSLKDDPTSEMAAGEIERLARITAAWEEAAAAYVDVLEGVTDGPTKRALLVRLARVFDEELHDVERAEGAYQLALEVDPRDAEVLELLDQLYVRGGLLEPLEKVLVQRLDVVVDPQQLVELRLRLGRAREDIGDYDGAIAAYRAVLDRESRDPSAIEALEKLHFRRAEWKDLFGIYEMMLDLAKGDAEMAEVYAHLAKIASDGLDDPARAEELWTRVLDLRGEDTTALSEMATLAEAGGRWTDAVAFLDRQGKAERAPERRVALLERVGRVLGDRLGDDAGAANAWNGILEIDADNLTALRALAGIQRRGEAWESLIATLRRILDAGAGALGQAEVVSTLSEIAWVDGERLAHPAEAIEDWRRVLAADPRGTEALDNLERLLLDEGRWSECVDVLEKKASLAQTPEDQADALLRAALLWHENLGDKDRAAATYERVLAADAGSAQASAALEEILREKGNFERVVELLIQRVDHTPEAARRMETLREVARLYEENLGAPELAFVALQAAFKEDYTNEPVVADLERIAQATGKWSELLTEYTQVARELGDPQTAANLWTKIGRWYGERLGHVEYAIASLQQALTLVPEHPGALSVLAAVYRRANRWRDVTESLARQIESEADPQRKVKVLLDLADVYETQTGEFQQAVNTYQRALSLDDACLDALESLDRLYRRSSSWDRLVEVLGRKAAVLQGRGDGGSGTSQEVVSLKLLVGEIWEDKLLDSTRAVEAYKDALGLDQREGRALRALERLYDKSGRFEEYIDVLDQQLEMAQSDDERIALHERLAATWEERFGRVDRAAECFEKVLEIDQRRDSAYRALERIYREQRRWDPLIDVLRKHIEVARDPGDRVVLYQQLGAIHEEELRDPHRAIPAFAEILQFDPEHLGALSALSRLYEKTEQWDRMADVTTRLAGVATETAQKVDLFYRLGRLAELRVGDMRAAEERYAQALEIDPSHSPSLQALASLYRNRGDWLKAAQLMVKAADHTQNTVVKAGLLYDAARIYEDRLDDQDQALVLYAKTLEVDPDHVGAAVPLGEAYWKQQRWQEAGRVLEVVARKPEGREPKQLAQLYYRLARANEENGDLDRALKYYKASYDLDATSLDTLKGMAGLHYTREDWDQAFRIYQTILVQHRDAQAGAGAVDVYYRLGRIKLKQGEHKKSLNMLAKALEIEPAHRPALEASAELHAAMGDFEQVYAARKAIVEGESGDERFRLLCDLGELCKDKLQNPQRSAEAFAEASTLRPNEFPILHTLLGLYTELKNWKKAVETILRIADLEADPLRKGKFHYTAAAICHDEMKSLDDAVEHYDAALDLYLQKPDAITPENMGSYLKAFEKIDRILTQTKDWPGLQRAYRRMLKRLPSSGHEILKVNLWHGLGEIFRSRLKDFPAAAEAFEVAATLDPTNETRHQILAELYTLMGGEHLTKAVKEHQILIRQNPSRIDSYQALYQIYAQSGQIDKAWCIASALAFLRKADPGAQQFFEQYRPKSLVRARARVSDELWIKHVYHQDQDKYISAILGLLSPAVYARVANEPKAFQLNPKKEKRNLAEDPLLFTKVFRYVHGVMNLGPVELYAKAETVMGLRLAPTRPVPAFVVGADLLQGRSERELAFVVARQLAYLRPEHMLRQIAQTGSALKTLLLAGIKAVEPGFTAPLSDELGQLVTHFQKALAAEPARAEQLAILVKRFLQQKPEIDLSKWMNAVDLTAQRAGLVVCGDLETAARMVSMEAAPVGAMSAKDRVKELLLYALSEDYFTTRREMGAVVA